MSQPVCPKCSATLKDDYGMVPCPSCGSFVFVDMDGIAHISRDEASEAEPAFEPETVAPLAEPPVVEDLPQDFSTSPEAFGSLEVPSFEPPQLETPPLETPMESEPDVYQEEEVPLSPPQAEEASAEFSMDGLLGFDDPSASAEGAPEAEMEFGAPGDPLGINEYANSEISQAKDGLLTFKILISGIDSKEMRESLRSVLDDQRFGWNTSDLMSRISKGVLQIENVASVKAVILINRIKRMPVKVRWEQYAITNMDSN